MVKIPAELLLALVGWKSSVPKVSLVLCFEVELDDSQGAVAPLAWRTFVLLANLESHLAFVEQAEDPFAAVGASFVF